MAGAFAITMEKLEKSPQNPAGGGNKWSPHRVGWVRCVHVAGKAAPGFQKLQQFSARDRFPHHPHPPGTRPHLETLWVSRLLRLVPKDVWYGQKNKTKKETSIDELGKNFM